MSSAAVELPAPRRSARRAPGGAVAPRRGLGRLRTARAVAREFGLGALAMLAFRHLVNRLIEFDVLIVVRQGREQARVPDTPDGDRLSARVMRAHEFPALLRRIDPAIVAEHGLAEFAADARPDDVLLVNYVGQQLAGFTFAHDGGSVGLLEGVRMHVPDGYLYNFSAFTMPAFRGRKHQGWRHWALLHAPECAAVRGLIGYVLCDNLASRRGLRKSGYVPVGNIYRLAWRGRSFAWVGPRARRAGVHLVRRRRSSASRSGSPVRVAPQACSCRCRSTKG